MRSHIRKRSGRKFSLKAEGLPSFATNPTRTSSSSSLASTLSVRVTDMEYANFSRGGVATAALLAALGTGLLATGGTLSKLTNGGGVAAQLDAPFDGTAPYRSREMAYYLEHPERFEHLIGQWVAVEGQTIIAHGVDTVEVVSQARLKGVKVPFVFRVESKREGDEGTIGL